jgi:hypothetical protein
MNSPKAHACSAAVNIMTNAGIIASSLSTAPRQMTAPLCTFATLTHQKRQCQQETTEGEWRKRLVRVRSITSDAAAPVARVAARTLCRHDVAIVIVVIVCERLHLLAVLHKEFTSNWLVEA